MTTHDYQGETNPSLTQVDPATANDPGWQRQADEFAVRIEPRHEERVAPKASSGTAYLAGRRAERLSRPHAQARRRDATLHERKQCRL